MKFRKPGKALEKSVRKIHDSEEFLAHVAGVASLYRRERELSESARRSELRQALRTFERHATALNEWLAHAGNARNAENAALQLLSKQLSTTDSNVVRDWLAQAATQAQAASDELKSTKPDVGQALRTAGDALKATFEHHRLKWSTTIPKGQPAPALDLLCAIARDAGDKSLTPAEAREALRIR